ncbi:MAG: PIG-L deacetylase family protein [Acidimicrobiia bacterium]
MRLRLIVATAVSIDLPVPASVLAIGAHADDVEFGAGATLAKWADGGAAVHLLVLTDGSKGTWRADTSLPELVAARRREQEKAAAVLGIRDVSFLDLADGELTSGRAEQALVCAAIRNFRPEVVMGHDPWQRYRLHPDHRHAGFLVTDGIVAARDPHFFPEQGMDPHRPERLLLFEADAPDHFERVDGFVDTKIEALLCHRSQWETTMKIEADSPEADVQRDAFARRVIEEAGAAGAPAGLAHAEAFKLIEDL